MWESIDIIWQKAFELAWDSFKQGTIPIGAVLANENGLIISTGRNRIFDDNEHPLSQKMMGHAEMDALYKIKHGEHPNIRKYTLYSTMEPCPMCFGTAVMVNIRNIKYAAKDYYAGACHLNDAMDYISRKNILIEHIGEELEAFQIFLQSSYEFVNRNSDIILSSFRKANNDAVDLAYEMVNGNELMYLLDANTHISIVYDYIILRLFNKCKC